MLRLSPILLAALIVLSQFAAAAEKQDAKPETFVIKTYTVPEAVWAGLAETWFIISRTGQYLWELVTGRQSPDQMGGPIMIAMISSSPGSR